MSARGKAVGVEGPGDDSFSEVRLRGRLAADPVLRELPSGDSVWSLRVVVQRRPAARRKKPPRSQVDSLDCAVWAGSLASRVGNWRAGDTVEVSGSLRRRFFRAAGATTSRVEVELDQGRLTRRAGSG